MTGPIVQCSKTGGHGYGNDPDLMDAGMTRHLLLQLLRGAITNDGSHSITAYVIGSVLASELVNGQMHLPTRQR